MLVSGRLVIIGSGENAPTMVKFHRSLMEHAGDGPKMMLDTPFGFQVNADDLTSKYQQYFDESVGQRIEIGRWRRKDDPAVEQERTLSLLGKSDWVFAGPGSPSYALQHWQGTPIPDALLAVLQRQGTLVIGSAAAATIGEFAIPVYEIYKVGLDPYWLDGINLLGQAAGINAVVVPHFDNREGGRHDTSCCYIGLKRLEQLEATLPDGVSVIGVDEHTAVLFDLDEDVVSVHGAGGLTLRSRGTSTFIASGESLTLDELRAFLDAPAKSGAHAPSASAPARDARSRFDACIAAADASGAAAVCLEVEQRLFASATEVDHLLLRSMLVELADAAQHGLQDKRSVLEPLVNVALEVRRVARENKDYAMSDLVRDSLAAVGIEVRDTPDGMVWE